MSSKSGKGGWKPSFGRSSSKGKDKEHSDKHGASNYQRSNSISKGGASGSRKQSSGSHDGDYSAHGKSAIPITVTSSATVSKPKVQSPGGAKRVDPPSGKDLDYVFHSLTSDPHGRRDSKNELEHYKEQSRKFKSEIEDLREQLENAQTRARVHNQTAGETHSLVGEKDKELTLMRKAQEDATDQLKALQKRYTLLNQEKDKVEADKMKLEQSYTAKIVDLEQQLSKTSGELSIYNKELLQAQEDISLHETEKIKELEKQLKSSNAALQEEQERVKRRDKSLSKLDVVAQNYSKELDTVKAKMEEVKISKLTLENLYQQAKASTEKKIAQLESTVVKQTQEYANATQKMTSTIQEHEAEIEQMKTKLQLAETELQRANDEKKDKVLLLENVIRKQAAREEEIKASIRENKLKHEQQLTSAIKEKEDAITQLQELQCEKDLLEQQVKNENQQITKEDLQKAVKETKLRVEELEKAHEVKLNEVTEEATANKEALEQLERQYNLEVKTKDEQINDLKDKLEQKEGKIKTLEDNMRKQTKIEPIGQVEQLLKDKVTLEQQMKDGYKEREDRIAELEEFINDQVTELDKMEAAMKQTVANKEIAEKELNEALEKKQAELSALLVAYENKGEEIRQSFSHMSVDKEEMDQIKARLKETEEQLIQANKELQANKEKEMQVELCKKNMEIDNLNKQIAELQGQCKAMQLLATKVSDENALKTDQELVSPRDSSDQVTELHEKITLLEEELDSTKSSMQQEREKVKELETKILLLQSVNKESSNKGGMDNGALLHETTKRLTGEVATLKQQLQEQNEQEMQTKIRELTQQIKHLQEESKKLQSSTSHHVGDEEFCLSVEEQHTDHSVELQKKVNQLEADLERAKLMLEVERKRFEEQVNELKAGALHEQSADQDITTGKSSRDHSSYVQEDLDRLSREHEGCKQTQDQFYQGYQKLKDRYRKKEEEVIKLQVQINQLKCEFESQKLELSKSNKELKRISGLDGFVQKQYEKPIMAERDQDIATAVIDEKKSGEIEQIELSAKIIEMRNNHLLVVNSKNAEIDNLEKRLHDKELELSELKAHKQDLVQKLAQKHDRIAPIAAQTAAFDNVKDTELLQGHSRESTNPSPRTEASKDTVVMLREKDQTIEKLSKQVEHLQKQQMKSSDDSGVGGPCLENAQSGGVGDFPNEGIHNADTKCQLSELHRKIETLTKELTMKESAATNQLDQLTKELVVERSVTENAKSEMDKLMDQLQQLRRDNKRLDQQMKDGYKEREDRIAELEEFINDQVTELDKMESAMKQTVANKQLLEKDHQKLTEYYNIAKNLVEQYEQRHIDQEETITMARQKEENANKAIAFLEQEKEGLILANQKMSREVARLMSVDAELDKSKKELNKAEEELQTKEFILNTYKEDFEQERKDRENAHSIKEDEITKARVKMEEFKAECQEKIKNVQQSVEVQMNTLKQQVNQLAIERDKFKKENERLRTDLDKEKKDAQTKFDVYKKKTEQFQLQWKKREEAEVKITTLTEQLNNQHELNRQLTSTIDTMMRRSKGIEPHIPSNNIASQSPSHQQRRISPHNPAFSNMSTQADISSDQYHTPSTVSSSDTSLSHTNAGMGYHHQPLPSSTSQSSRQRQQEQQYHYKMQQQQQEEQLHSRGQGRGAMHNQSVKPQHEATHYPFDHQGQGKKFLPPANIDHKQPRSIQPGAEYNVAGTNAAPTQISPDNYNYARSSGPASLDSSITTKPRPSAGHANLPPVAPLAVTRRPEKPTQYASEGINEEIRYQADKQRRYQEYESFDSNLQLDPYLICPKCKFQFREGQLPEYRHHIDNCHQ